MDILEQFLNSIAYKFPKGYPDMGNEQDVLLLENELKLIGIDLNELINTKHYIDRKKERGNINDILNLNKQITGDKYQPEDIKPEIINNIESELNKRLSYLEELNAIPISFSKTVAYKILKPILKINNTNHELLLKAEYDSNGVSKSNTGTFYVAIVSSNKLITLLLLESKSDSELEDQIINHSKREDLPIQSVTILTFDNFEYIIPLGESTQQKELIDPSTLPYKLKTSYRVGSDFTHNDYGTGKVIAAASAGTRSGEPDSRGMVDWVEVDFGKPYVSGGELKKTRMIKNVYTTLSPLISK